MSVSTLTKIEALECVWLCVSGGMTADGRPPDINEQDRKDTPRYAAFIVSSRATAAGM